MHHSFTSAYRYYGFGAFSLQPESAFQSGSKIFSFISEKYNSKPTGVFLSSVCKGWRGAAGAVIGVGLGVNEQGLW